MGFKCMNRGHVTALLGFLFCTFQTFALPTVIELPEQNPSPTQLESVKLLNKEFATLEGQIYHGLRQSDRMQFKTAGLTPLERKEASEKTKLLGWDQCRNTTAKLFQYPIIKYDDKNFLGMTYHLALIIVTPGFAPKRVEAGAIGWRDGAWVKFSPDCGSLLLAAQDRKLELVRLSAAASEQPKISKLNYEFVSPRYLFFTDNRTLIHFRYKGIDLLSLDSDAKKEIDRGDENTWVRMVPSRGDELCWAKYGMPKSSGSISVRCLNRLSGKMADPQVFKDPREGGEQLRIVKVDAQRIAVEVTRGETSQAFMVTTGEDSPAALPEGGVLRVSDSRLVFLRKQGLNEDVMFSYDIRNQQILGKTWEAQPNGWFQYAQEEPDHLLVTATNSYGQTTHYSFTAAEGVQHRFTYPDYQAPVKVRTLEITDHHGLARPAFLLSGRQRYELAKNVFVFVHGGGCHLNWHIGQSQIVLPEMLSMAERGYPVLAITYRNDKLPTPYNSDGKARTAETCGTEELDDIESGYKAVKKLYPTANVFLWGMSHGGYLVNVMATQDPRAKLFKGIVSQAGIWTHDLGTKFLEGATDHYRADRAPINYVQRLDVPFFMYHGTYDRNAVYALHAEQFLKLSGVVPSSGDEHTFRFYRHPNKPVSALIIEGDDHHFSETKSFDLFVQALENFVKQNQ